MVHRDRPMCAVEGFLSRKGTLLGHPTLLQGSLGSCPIANWTPTQIELKMLLRRRTWGPDPQHFSRCMTGTLALTIFNWPSPHLGPNTYRCSGAPQRGVLKEALKIKNPQLSIYSPGMQLQPLITQMEFKKS